MKALVLKTGGSISGLRMEDIPKPEIRDDELLVRVRAAGLNPSDYQTAEYYRGGGLDIVLGLDVSGEVVKAGGAVSSFKPGDRIFYIRELSNPFGGFAEFAVTPERFACRIPDGVSFEEAASLPGAGFTAYHIMYDRFHLISGRTILIQGGAGGVGSFAVQMAKQAGLRVIATCRPRDIDYVRSLGADAAVDYRAGNEYARILELTDGRGVDYALSSVGSKTAEKDLNILRFGGELAVTAGLPDLSGWAFYDRGLTVHEIAFGGYLQADAPGLQKIPAQIAEKLAAMVSEQIIHVPRLHTIPLEEVPEGLCQMKERKISGKLIALPE